MCCCCCSYTMNIGNQNIGTVPISTGLSSTLVAMMPLVCVCVLLKPVGIALRSNPQHSNRNMKKKTLRNQIDSKDIKNKSVSPQ